MPKSLLKYKDIISIRFLQSNCHIRISMTISDLNTNMIYWLPFAKGSFVKLHSMLLIMA